MNYYYYIISVIIIIIIRFPLRTIFPAKITQMEENSNIDDIHHLFICVYVRIFSAELNEISDFIRYTDRCQWHLHFKLIQCMLHQKMQTS